MTLTFVIVVLIEDNYFMANINTTYINVDRKQELLSDFEEKLEIQAEELRITKQHLGRVQDKLILFAEECMEKAEEADTLRGMYKYLPRPGKDWTERKGQDTKGRILDIYRSGHQF